MNRRRGQRGDSQAPRCTALASAATRLELNYSEALCFEGVVLVFANSSTANSKRPYSQTTAADALPELSVQLVFQPLQRCDTWCDCAA